VKSRPIPKRNLPARSKGFGFVEFETEEEQKRLIESKVKLVAEDRELSIKIALNEDRTSTSETTPATTSETAPATTSEASPGATPEVASATETPATTEPASVASPPPASKPAATEEDPNMVDWS
jgi:RNA recognition motif-containing protein